MGLSIADVGRKVMSVYTTPETGWNELDPLTRVIVIPRVVELGRRGDLIT